VILKQGCEGVHVVDAWENLLEVPQSELLLLKLNNDIDVFL